MDQIVVSMGSVLVRNMLSEKNVTNVRMVTQTIQNVMNVTQPSMEIMALNVSPVNVMKKVAKVKIVIKQVEIVIAKKML